MCIAYSLYLLKQQNIKLILKFDKVENDEVKKIQQLVLFYHPNTEYNSKFTINKYDDDSTFLIPGNFISDEYINELYNSLLIYKNKLVNIKRLWLIGSCTALLIVLLKLLPNTSFNVVNINHNHNDKTNDSRITNYTSSYKLYDIYNGKIGYNTTLSTDAKIWEFINDKQLGENGDYVWNTSGAHNYNY